MRAFTIVALALAIGLAAAVSPFASSRPDGLERIAEDKAFSDSARQQERSPIPDYALPGIGNERVATGAAGFIGTLVVFGLAYGVAALARRRPTAA
jgi:hypothetical protein